MRYKRSTPVRPVLAGLALSLMVLSSPIVSSAASPDLVVTQLSASPSIIAPGDPLTIRAAVNNQGDGKAGYFRTGFFLSKDPVITADDIRIGSPKGNETESLAAGEREPFTYRTNLISVDAGIYYLGATADYRNQVSESNEKNNSRSGKRVLITRSEPVAAGEGHSLALKPDGSLRAWGDNSLGQLGDGTKESRDSPVRVGKDAKWVAVAAGAKHSLGLKSDGSLWAWGDNSFGQLGTGVGKNETSPVRIGKDGTWTAISAGSRHSLGLKKDGTLWAWGDNAQGQLGDGTKTAKTVPVQVGRDGAWAKVSAGAYHTVALRNDMTLWSWGGNSRGQLGDGTRDDRSSPVRIGTDARWYAVSAGEYHTVALNWCADCWTTNALWAWGANEYGQLGDGAMTDRPSPVRIGDDKSWVKAFAGSHHAVALKKDGTLWAWGRNDKGQLGDGTTENRNSPVRIGAEANWASISTGARHSLAVKSDDGWWSWGGNSLGQPGNGKKPGKIDHDVK